MSRHEDGFDAVEEAILPVAETLVVSARMRATGGLSRADALACFLTGEVGWTEAGRSLGGAFADPSRLTGDEED